MKTLRSIPSQFTILWLLMAVLITPQAICAQSWQATVGAQSDDKGRQGLAFLPNEIWIHAGDSITWTSATDEVHTVTFLKPGQVRPPRPVGCPGTTPDGSLFDGSSCVNGGLMTRPQTYTVTFPAAGNFKLVCLVHANMTAVVHVLDPSEVLPYDQGFYDDQAGDERRDLLLDRDHQGDSANAHSHGNQVAAGVGEIVATPGGHQTLSVVRFMQPTTVVHVGDTVEWSNMDAVTPHTITFGPEPANTTPPSANVTLDADGARHAVISSPADVVHSGFIAAAPQERIGLAQSLLPPSPGGTVTRFRVTFTQPGTFDYKCALHDDLGMVGQVIVLP